MAELSWKEEKLASMVPFCNSRTTYISDRSRHLGIDAFTFGFLASGAGGGALLMELAYDFCQPCRYHSPMVVCRGLTLRFPPVAGWGGVLDFAFWEMVSQFETQQPGKTVGCLTYLPRHVGQVVLHPESQG